MIDNAPIILPMASHVIWVCILYAALTLVRAPSVWGIGSESQSAHLFKTVEPKVSANLSSQFEWPLFFYVITLLLLLYPEQYSSAQLFLAWLFLIGRVVHSLVQIFIDNIRLRGIVFTVNFLAVIAMWVVFLF